VWREWAAASGRDIGPILAVAHGPRTSETLRAAAPDLDVSAEVARRGPAPVATARELLTSLPPHGWAIVTSGGPAVARLRMTVAELPMPRVFIAAADVPMGEPAPDGILLARADFIAGS